jgi:hypothetical protein
VSKSNLRAEDPLVVNAVQTIHAGDILALQRMLVENPGLATSRILDAKGATCTLLHKVADWPGHFPNGATSVALIAAAAGDPSAPILTLDSTKRDETPLHWAASSDDVAVLDALLDAGANIEAPGACIAGGTALDDAVAFGQWRAAHRLVERGARTALWHSSALGLMDRVEAHFAGPRIPPLYPWGDGRGASLDEVTIAFWCACHGGQRAAAEYLLDRGAKLNWISEWDELTPLDAAQRADAAELIHWLRSRGAKSTKELRA